MGLGTDWPQYSAGLSQISVPEIEIVAINDLASIDMAAFLLEFDTVHGRFKS